MRSEIAGLAGAALLAALVAAPADATVRERFSVEESWSYAEDCGFPVQVTGSRSDLFTIREGKNKDAGAFPVLNRRTYSERWTNTDTGEWFVIRGRGTFNEVQATRVEGSVFEFRFVEAGQPFVVVDSDGKVVVRNNGSVHGSYLFDTGGDDMPGGDWIADLDLQDRRPAPELDPHPCDYAVELIG